MIKLWSSRLGTGKLAHELGPNQLLRPGPRLGDVLRARTPYRGCADRTHQLVANVLEVSAQIHYVHRLWDRELTCPSGAAVIAIRLKSWPREPLTGACISGGSNCHDGLVCVAAPNLCQISRLCVTHKR